MLFGSAIMPALFKIKKNPKFCNFLLLLVNIRPYLSTCKCSSLNLTNKFYSCCIMQKMLKSKSCVLIFI